MKESRRFLCLFVLAIHVLFAVSSEIELRFEGGEVTDSLKNKITRNFNSFISTISQSRKDTCSPSSFDYKAINENVYKFMESHSIICEDIDTIYSCNKTKMGFEIRGVNVVIQKGDPINVERQLTVVFTRDGIISNIFFSIENSIYNNIFDYSAINNSKIDSISNTGDVDTYEDKRTIINFIEQYQTSYKNKDIAFLEALFNEDALIITGTKITSHHNHENINHGATKTMYRKENKEKYLNYIRRDLMSKAKPNLNISDIEIKQHPSNKQIYGVTIVQKYKSDKYDDESKLFLIVDTSKNHFVILKKMFLSKEESIDIRDFPIK